jgi:hypothetical protein
MAGKSAVPLALGIGAAALLLSGKRKKASESSSPVDVSTAYSEIDWMDPDAQGAKLVLDEECMNIAHKINPEKHNTYITNRFNQMVSEGWDEPQKITLQLLSEQSEHCPWGEPGNWTPMMKGLFDQLNAAVASYYELYASNAAPSEA